MEKFSEQNALQVNGEFGLCTELLARVSAKASSSNDTKVGVTVAAILLVPTFNILLLGENKGQQEAAAHQGLCAHGIL